MITEPDPGPEAREKARRNERRFGISYLALGCAWTLLGFWKVRLAHGLLPYEFFFAAVFAAVGAASILKSRRA